MIKVKFLVTKKLYSVVYKSGLLSGSYSLSAKKMTRVIAKLPWSFG